jgi:hypothetical protein
MRPDYLITDAAEVRRKGQEREGKAGTTVALTGLSRLEGLTKHRKSVEIKRAMTLLVDTDDNCDVPALK